MPGELSAQAELDYDNGSGMGFVRFVDDERTLIDGSRGVDSLFAGFVHRERTYRLPDRYSNLLALVAEHGGRWVPQQGFAVREEALPDLKRALQALPDDQAPRNTPSATEVSVDSRPLKLTQVVELDQDDALHRSPGFVDASRSVQIPVNDVLYQAASRLWVRQGARFYRRPDLAMEELAAVPKMSKAPLRGDDVPYFFAKQLAALEKEGTVVLGPNAAKARVLETPWLPDVTIALSNEGRLRLGVSFSASGHRIGQQQLKNAGRSRYIPVAKGTWVVNDRKAQALVEKQMGSIPEVGKTRLESWYDAPAFALPLVQEAFSKIGTVTLTASAEAFRRKLEDFREIEPAPLPKGLSATLRAYQKAGYDWLSFLRKYGLRGVLADDMGLGKTLQSLATILAAMEDGDQAPALVVCPASVTSVWRTEVERWCSGVTAVVLNGTNRASFLRTPSPRTIAIASYAAVARNANSFATVLWSYVVLDEAHRIKNPAALTTKACKRLLSKHRLAVTGTPVQNRLAELWSIFDFLMPSYLGGAAAFQREYEIPITNHQDAEAAAKLRCRIEPFKLRREKGAVAKDLPALSQQVLQVSLLASQREIYERIVRDSAPELIRQLKGGSASSLQVLEKLLRLRQVAAHPKLVDPYQAIDDCSGKFETFKDLLRDALDDGQKILVFSQWVGMAKLITDHLRATDTPFAYLDGSVLQHDRQAVVAKFQSTSGPPVMVLSLLAGGEGITLTAASVVILFDRWWNPAVEDQAVARAHRIGQTLPVTAYVLEAKDTIEERLADLLRRKKSLAASVIHVDQAEKRVSREDLIQLLDQELEAVTRVGRVGAA